MRRLHNIGRLFTGTQAGVIEKAAIICNDDEHIAWCGREGEEPIDLLGYVAHEEDCGGGLVTGPLSCLIDARLDESSGRMKRDRQNQELVNEIPEEIAPLDMREFVGKRTNELIL